MVDFHIPTACDCRGASAQHSGGMSTTESLPTRHTLRTDDPSELYAEAQLLMHGDVSNRLVLIGHHDRRAVDAVSAIPLSYLLGAEDPLAMAMVTLDLLRSQGATGAFALIVAESPETPGDAAQDPDEAELLPGAPLGFQLLCAARLLDPIGFDIPEVWLIADGRAQPLDIVTPDEGSSASPDAEISLAIGPVRDLVPPEETSVMAQAVIAGRPLPLSRRTREERLTAVHPACRQGLRRARRTPGTSGSGGEVWARSWEAVQDVLARVRGGCPEGIDAEEADLIATVLRRLAHREDFEALLEHFIRRGNRTDVAGELLVPEITRDPRLRPHADVRTDGAAHEAVEDLLLLAESLELEERTPEGAEEIDGAIVNLHLLLCALDWWQFRFATASAHAGEALQRAPWRTFAQCFVEMTAVPLVPAWQPGQRTGQAVPRRKKRGARRRRRKR